MVVQMATLWRIMKSSFETWLLQNMDAPVGGYSCLKGNAQRNPNESLYPPFQTKYAMHRQHQRTLHVSVANSHMFWDLRAGHWTVGRRNEQTCHKNQKCKQTVLYLVAHKDGTPPSSIYILCVFNFLYNSRKAKDGSLFDVKNKVIDMFASEYTLSKGAQDLFFKIW